MVRPPRLGDRQRLSHKSSRIPPKLRRRSWTVTEPQEAYSSLRMAKASPSTPSYSMASATSYSLLCMAPMTTSISPATRVGSWGSTKVRMFGDADGPEDLFSPGRGKPVGPCP